MTLCYFFVLSSIKHLGVAMSTLNISVMYFIHIISNTCPFMKPVEDTL